MTGQEKRDTVDRAWWELVTTARGTASEGLVVGTSGSVPVRAGGLILVTPSGIPYEQLGPEDVVGVGLDGRRVVGDFTPTSELAPHRSVYRHTSAAAVVHTHAVHATAVSTLVPELPPIH